MSKTTKRPLYLDMAARLSPCGQYRYSLSRRMSMGDRVVLFVGLNPSTADAENDDPTIRREVDYAMRWGFDWYLKANVYGYRSTNPDVLPRVPDPVGPHNADAVLELSGQAELIICAWGKNPLTPAARVIAASLIADPRARYLKLNNDGSPSHPLYLRKSLIPQRFAEAKA